MDKDQEKAAKARESALNNALGQIEQEFGQGSIMRMGDEAFAVKVAAIPTGALSLDLALGVGGVPRGRIVEIFGPESSGKTTLLYHILASAQRMGGICAFIDAEHAMDPIYAKRIGVDIDELLVSQPDHGEQALEIADVLIRSGALDVVAIDSVAALTPKVELEGAMGDQTVGVQARMMSQAMRKLAGNLNRAKTLCVFTNQIREKVGVMFGSPGDPARRPRAQVLFQPAPRHPPHRDPQGGHRGDRQPGAREGRQEQGRGAVPAGRVRHRVRARHLERGLPDRPGARARHRPEVGLVLLLRGRAPRPGAQQRQGATCARTRTRPRRSSARSTRPWGSSRPAAPLAAVEAPPGGAAEEKSSPRRRPPRLRHSSWKGLQQHSRRTGGQSSSRCGRSSTRDRTVAELRTFLERKRVEPAAIDAAVAELTRPGCSTTPATRAVRPGQARARALGLRADRARPAQAGDRPGADRRRAGRSEALDRARQRRERCSASASAPLRGRPRARPRLAAARPARVRARAGLRGRARAGGALRLSRAPAVRLRQAPTAEIPWSWSGRPGRRETEIPANRLLFG